MIKTKAKILGFLMAMLLALSVPLVYADNSNGGDMSGGQPSVSDGRSSGHLNLTDDQKKQLKDIWQKQRETMKAAVGQLKANREALNKELILSTPDMSKINALQAQLKTLQAQMADNHLNSTLEVKKILTPEQFGKYLEFQKKMFAARFHREEWGHCRHHHRHHRHHFGNFQKHWGDDGDHYDND